MRRRRFHLSLLPLILLLVVLWSARSAAPSPDHPDRVRTSPSLVTDIIANGVGQGGRWFIPPQWLERARSEAGPWESNPLVSSTTPQTILQAAQLALELALRQEHYLDHSEIPLIVHQTWKDTNPGAWKPRVRERVEEWLRVANDADDKSPKMAYLLWDDDGLDSLVEELEPTFAPSFQLLPLTVERADIFRVAVLKWFGGVYADIDTMPLQHPAHWIHDVDMMPWKEQTSTKRHQVYEPSTLSARVTADASSEYHSILALRGASSAVVGVIVGVECDVAPSSEDYWRAGYTYPVQLTNWAFAMAPQHPLAVRYLNTVDEAVQLKASGLEHVDPLELTGPPMLTKVTMAHCDDVVPGFPWTQLSGLDDEVGGRGKVAAGDVLVLPITGFSPGRGSFHNMGSQPSTHPSARLHHLADGTWRHANLKVTVGKLCRTLFGACRYWSKIP